MTKLEMKIKSQIEKIKEEILTITDQIELFRTEGTEDEVGISTELQDKLEILSEKVAILQKNLAIYQDSRYTAKVCVGKTINISNHRIKNKEITLVLPEDADPQSGYVSSESPLGGALINKDKGDTVLFETPAGNQEFIIDKIM